MSEDSDRLWRNSDFVKWWFSNLTSSLGDQVTAVAFPLLVLLVTGSPLQAGMIAAVSAIPNLLLSIPAGAMIDRLPRRLVMTVSYGVGAAAVITIPIAWTDGSMPLVQLYIVSLVLSAATMCARIADNTVLPRVVNRGQLDGAVANYETVWGFAAVLGPPLAGLLFETVSPGAPFFVHCAALVLSAFFILLIKRKLGADPPFPEFKWSYELSAGFKAVMSERLLRILTIATTVGDFLFSGIALLVIVIVQSNGATPSQTGFAFTGAAVGGILGSLLAPAIGAKVGLTKVVVVKHFLTFAMFPLLLLEVPAWVTGVIWGLIVFQVSVLNVLQSAYLLRSLGSDVIGRARGFTSCLESVAVPLGVGMMGVMLSSLETRGTVIVLTAALGVLAVFISVALRVRRDS